jgi:DNA-binding transcriptional ArsR family regulator
MSVTGFELEVGLVIEIDMAHTDLAQLRFAHSPVRELVASLQVLHDRSRHQMYGAWLSTVRGRLGGLRVDLLTALAPSTPYSLDFAAPSSTRPWEVLDDELVVVAATPPDRVRAELDWVYQGRRLPEVLRPLYDDPKSQLPVLTAEMVRYWRVAVEPVWPRLRALCSADLVHRMEQFAAGGIARVLRGLHPEVAFEDGRLLIDKPYTCHHRVDLAGSGIVLVPCAFSWPTLSVQCCGGAEQPALSYPPRGVAGLWGQAPDDRPTALSRLVGRTRATMLTALDLPATTTQLAGQLGISPAAVSQHLKILKGSALVTGQRRGRLVLYRRTEAATALLATTPPDEDGSATPGRP